MAELYSAGMPGDPLSLLDTILGDSPDPADPADEGVGPGALSVLIAQIEAEIDLGGSAPAEGSADHETLLRFRVLDRLYAVPSSQALALEAPPQTTEVPGLPGFVGGLASFRGEIVPIFDLRRLGGLPDPVAPSPRMIVIRDEQRERTAGMLVDASLGVVDWRSQLRQDPDHSADPLGPFVQGAADIEGQTFWVVDLAAWMRTVDITRPWEPA